MGGGWEMGVGRRSPAVRSPLLRPAWVQATVRAGSRKSENMDPSRGAALGGPPCVCEVCRLSVDSLLQVF